MLIAWLLLASALLLSLPRVGLMVSHLLGVRLLERYSALPCHRALSLQVL